MLKLQSDPKHKAARTYAKASLFFRFCLFLSLTCMLSACGTSGSPSTSSSLQQPALAQGENSSENSSVAVTFDQGPGQSAATGEILPEVVLNQNNSQTDVSDKDTGQDVLEATCSAEPLAMQQRTLQLINAARAQARSCGNEHYAAVQAVGWNTILATVASAHSIDMATHNFFSHTGSDGSSASMRVQDAGYTWRTIGENIAAGRTSASQTIDDWLNSPGHCRNIMNPNFTHVAVSCVEASNTDFKRYWTNVLAAPR